MSRMIDRLPALKRAMLEIAYDNNMIGNPSLGGSTEEQVLDQTEEVLGAEGVDFADLVVIDAWLATLTQEELELVCSGEESEAAEFMKSRRAPEHTSGLLNDLFEHPDTRPAIAR